MDLEPRISSALAEVAATLNHAQIRYQLGSSCLIRLSGHDVPVRDIDLILPGDARDDLVRACADWSPAVTEDGPEPWHSSWIARWRMGEVEVEAIGGLAIRIDGIVTQMPFQETGLDADVGGQVVPLGPITQWRQIYQVYRPETAALLGK